MSGYSSWLAHASLYGSDLVFFNMTLINKNILLGVTGGIAAYKAPDLIRKLRAQGANVRVVLTPHAESFVSALSLQAVSGHPVHTALLDPAAEAAMGHIELARWAHILLIAPCTANTMAKLSLGLADDLLSTLYLATTARVFIAPAMNQQMWKAVTTQQHIERLQAASAIILGPAEGEQACGDVGPGRMLEPEEIVSQLASNELPPLFANKHIVITAGPTREAIDPVRYISNHSSGKMGFALAHAAAELGARVTLISGPVQLPTPAKCHRIDVVSAQEMLEASLASTANADIFIACAAVADYRVVQPHSQKLKKTDDELTLTFAKNPDILQTIASQSRKPFTVGFAAESQHLEQYARDKLQRKHIDMIAANDISAEGLGFNSDRNALHVFWHGGEQQLPADNKKNLAVQLLQLIHERYQS
jgi:phosphopantothenoylcysteine decarboxylase/phosphopantothenate--cysteine ligase